MNQFNLTIEQIVKSNINIFDFEYPIFREEFREEFEKMFIDYFYLEEIAHETVGQFKLRLKSKLNLVMPYYNQVYMTQTLEQRILDNYDVKEVFSKTVSGQASSINKHLFKDTPKTRTDIDKFDIVSSINKAENNANSNGTETWELHKTGNIGVQYDSTAIISYWDSIRNVTKELFENELSSLFMGVF